MADYSTAYAQRGLEDIECHHSREQRSCPNTIERPAREITSKSFLFMRMQGEGYRGMREVPYNYLSIIRVLTSHTPIDIK